MTDGTEQSGSNVGAGTAAEVFIGADTPRASFRSRIVSVHMHSIDLQGGGGTSQL